MSQDKVIIDITERETTELTDQNDVKSIEGTGLLKVVNPSAEHRLWNLRLKNDHTKEAIAIDLPSDASKEALEPGKSWDFTYRISNLKEPILKLKEVFDTSVNAEGVNHNFVKRGNDRSAITFTLQNIAQKAIQNIKLTKQIPAYLKELKVETASTGSPNLDLDAKTIEWTIPSINADEIATLKVVGRADIEESSLKSGNPIDVSYESDMNLRSPVVPFIEALTDTMTGIDQEEDDSKPGWWNCAVEFDNESDFQVTVKTLKVSKKGAAGAETLVDITPKDIVDAKKSWKHKFSVESPSVPALNSALDFTANYTVPTRIISTIHQIPKTFPVLETTIAKDINPPEVNANANTEMTITNTIVNKGTANINSLDLKDIIPRDFEPPSVQQISMTIVSPSGDKIISLGNANAPIAITPDDKDTKIAHTIAIPFKELSEWFKPGCKLIVLYPIVARNPQPNTVYDTPVEIVSYTKPKGPGYNDKPVQLPSVGIRYVKRKVKTAKSISPSGKEGAFNVVIKISNQGGVEIENISVIEDIAVGFTAGEFKPEDSKPEYKEEGASKKLIWKIARLNPDESVKFQYVSEGQGEYPRTEPEVIIAEPDSLKKEKDALVSVGEGVSDQDKAFKDKNTGAVNDIVEELIQKLNKIVKSEEAGKLLENAKDQLISKGKSSPVLHEIGLEARELAKNGSKMLVGTHLDAILQKIREWRSRLIS